jgi:hypothetical protein
MIAAGALSSSIFGGGSTPNAMMPKWMTINTA